MSGDKRTTVGLGELLWDILPSGKQLGGAPANFAYITNLLGDIGIPASRVGRDSLGDEAIERLTKLGLSTACVQQDPIRPTGTVKVEIDAAGQPRFDIAEPAAWDFLEWTSSWQQLAENAAAVCFGSLAQRSSASRSTIRNFLLAVRPQAMRVFDVNLRQNFFSQQIIAESLELATIVKFNCEELPTIIRLFGFEHRSEETSARRLLDLYHNLKLVCITRGNNGSLLISNDQYSEHQGLKVKVADTVGAGDAFTAALVHGYLRRASLAAINETANRVGAWVASQCGAMPAPKAGNLAQVLSQIE